MKFLKVIIILSLVAIPACTAIMLQPADFAWPVETVLKVGDDGFVSENRYSISFNAKDLFLEEMGDSSSFKNKELRVIRNTSGYYFMAADNFKNVYVFNGIDGAMQLKNKIAITDTLGMDKPVFNQRPPNIELIYGSNHINITSDGIVEEEEK